VTTTAPPTPAPGPGPAPAPAPSGWWRRNRWALVALPLALLLVLAASADRVRTLWWEQGLHRPTVGAPGETVSFDQRVRDGLGGTSRIAVQVRLDGVHEPATLPRDLVVPDGARAVQVDLTLAADPDLVLAGCSLAVRDAAGTRYDYVSIAWGAYQPVSPCVPEDAPGPMPSLGDLDDEDQAADPGPPRPATWTVSPVVVLPADVEPTDVVLWWQLPQHVLLQVG
jgi:hypothetical protein